MRRFLAAAVSALSVAGSGYSQDLQAKMPAVAESELVRLSEQLGDRDYRVREAAGKRFADLGADCLPALKSVARTGNLEAAERAIDLITKIERAVANAKATAGTVVELKAEEQTLGAAFDALRKQTGYTIVVNGDQNPRSKKVTPQAGKVEFWIALQRLANEANLEVESAVNHATANGGAINTGPVSYDPGAVDSRPLGSVTLRPRQAKSSIPVFISGAFRIEAIPVPVANLPQMPALRVPVLLQITPEPRLRWVGTTQTIVTLAEDQDGRKIIWDHVAPDYQNNRMQFEGRGMRRGGKGDYGGPVHSPEYPATPFQAYLKLLAHADGPSTSLKTLEGRVRGKVWSESETILALANLSDSSQEVRGESRTLLKAKYEPMPGDASALLLSVTTSHNASEVVPFHGSSALNTNPDGLWLENGPGGRVKLKAVKLSPEELRMAQGYTNAYGLALVDGHGKPMNLSPHSVTQQNLYNNTDGSSTYIIAAQYIVRPADKEAEGKPAKITFSGTRMKSLEVAFRLKDVPVLRGIGTNVQARHLSDSFDR